MGLETGTYIDSLNAAWPIGATDPKSEGDDHFRLVKSTIKNSFPNIAGAMTATHTELNVLDGFTGSTAELNTLSGFTGSTVELNYLVGVTSLIQTQFDSKQPLHSNLTGVAAATPSLNYFLVANGATWITRPPSEARTSLGVDSAGTDNSTNVTLAGANNYLTLVGQEITAEQVPLTTQVSGVLPIANGGTNSSTATGAVTNFGFSATASEVNAICDGKTLTSSDDKIDNFPVGTLMVFQQTAAPTGWTKQTTHNDKAFRVVSGTASSGGASAFTTTFGSGKTSDSHTLLIAEIPSHTHTIPHGAGGLGGTANANDGRGSGVSGTYPSGSVGGDGGHTHPLTNFDLQYVDVIIGTKD